MYLFIDTNVLLSFYHLTSDDLEQLEKLAVLIRDKEITLELPQQVIDETKRNRGNKLNDSFQAFKKTKISVSFPAYCKDYPQYARMREAQRKFESEHSDLVARIQADIDNRKLAADSLLDKLFAMAEIINRTPEIISRARERAELGNPPGKKGSLGDAVNWESLLGSVPDRLHLHVVADDSDFYSSLDPNKLNEFP
jgi:hypothetical protein